MCVKKILSLSLTTIYQNGFIFLSHCGCLHINWAIKKFQGIPIFFLWFTAIRKKLQWNEILVTCYWNDEILKQSRLRALKTITISYMFHDTRTYPCRWALLVVQRKFPLWFGLILQTCTLNIISRYQFFIIKQFPEGYDLEVKSLTNHFKRDQYRESRTSIVLLFYITVFFLAMCEGKPTTIRQGMDVIYIKASLSLWHHNFGGDACSFCFGLKL